jgi:hypothetical protein
LAGGVFGVHREPAGAESSAPIYSKSAEASSTQSLIEELTSMLEEAEIAFDPKYLE